MITAIIMYAINRRQLEIYFQLLPFLCFFPLPFQDWTKFGGGEGEKKERKRCDLNDKLSQRNLQLPRANL